jgi:hypothetical protein
LIPTENLNTVTTPFFQKGDMREFSLINQKSYSNFFVRRSPFNQEMNRKFFKIDELISYVGGFASIFITTLGVFTIIYNKAQMIVELANE